MEIERTEAQRMVPGAALAGIGCLLLLYNVGLFPVEEILRYWPIALVVGGLMHILESK